MVNIMKLVKGDKVRVVKGKDRGQEGVISRVLPQQDKIIIEGVNVYKKHLKPRGDKSGGIVEVSRPLPVANVVALCPKTNKPTRLG
jgi:large subunit ribosomal protein L24